MWGFVVLQHELHLELSSFCYTGREHLRCRSRKMECSGGDSKTLDAIMAPNTPTSTTPHTLGILTEIKV